jgi:carboxyl-terminal processing protease
MKNYINKSLVIFFAIVLMSASFLGGFYVSRASSSSSGHGLVAYNDLSATSTEAESLDFNLYWEVWNKIRTEYVGRNKLTDADMFYGSLKGLAQSIGDPYTSFMTPDESKAFFEDMAGSFEGIGAEIGMRDDLITVVAPISGMPAEKAGIKAGDKIYAINGQATIGLSVDEAVRMIRGEKGTSVTLTVIHPDKDITEDISIIRDLIIVKSVEYKFRDDGIMVISIHSFGDDTISLFNEAVKQALLKDPKGIILDLRNNPGGYLDVAVSISSEWVKEGPVVAEQFSGGERNEYPAAGNPRLGDFPTVVLINGGSASASEIVAGALRDYHKATVVGTTSFGKGSVQSVEPLSNGSSVKITVANWLTPAGDFINEKGIDPEIEVKISESDAAKKFDSQMDKAASIIKNKK